MSKKISDRQMKDDESKDVYTFPKFRVVVKAKNPKEAEKKLKETKTKENE